MSSTAIAMDTSATPVVPAIVAKKARAPRKSAASSFSPAAKKAAATKAVIVTVDGTERKTRRVRKHKKDPNAPKRSQTAYLLFSNEVRNQIKTDFPDLDFGKVAKKISECWKGKTPVAKKVYEDKANADKLVWKAAQAAYLEAHRTPKKNCTAFIIYSNKHREQVKTAHPGIPFGHVAKHISVMWKALNEDSRKPFNAQAATDKARYDAEMVEYRLTHPVQPKPVAVKKVRAASAKKPAAKAAPSNKKATGDKPAKVASTKKAAAADKPAKADKVASSKKAAAADKPAKVASTKKAAAADKPAKADKVASTKKAATAAPSTKKVKAAPAAEKAAPSKKSSKKAVAAQ